VVSVYSFTVREQHSLAVSESVVKIGEDIYNDIYYFHCLKMNFTKNSSVDMIAASLHCEYC